jgi:hypothetical protein
MTAEPKPFDDPSDEREWQAQERAFQSEMSDDDASIARYRNLARALRALPREKKLPPAFARRVADAARREDRLLGLFERAVLTGLCVVFVVVLYALGQFLPASPSMPGWQWLGALLVCAAVAGLPTLFGTTTIRTTAPRMR